MIPEARADTTELIKPEKLASPIRALSDLVLLKLFIPPRYYESYLVFLPGGDPIGVINRMGAELLKLARGIPAVEIVTGSDGKINNEQIECLFQLIEKGLLVWDTGEPILHWITPDKKNGTRHKGHGAELFIQYFYDYFGTVFYEGSSLIDSHLQFLNVLSRYFPNKAGSVCLDAGSGSGYYAAALARLGHYVYACDINVTRLKSAVRQPHTPGVIEAVECNLENIPLSDNCIDFIMCNFVLEHVADPYAVIDELVRLLRPDGNLLLSVPSYNVRDTLAVWLHGEIPSLNFEHLRSYGLIPNTHPWCEPTLDTLSHLDTQGIQVKIVEGINILNGLWEPWASTLAIIANQHGEAFSTTWPWNCLGQQTIIFGSRRKP